jgi:hypothetical protein
MSKFDNSRDDGDNFERFKRKPKNPKKGKHNRSNEKQMIRDHFPQSQDDTWDNYDDFMEKWERQ